MNNGDSSLPLIKSTNKWACPLALKKMINKKPHSHYQIKSTGNGASSIVHFLISYGLP